MIWRSATETKPVRTLRRRRNYAGRRSDGSALEAETNPHFDLELQLLAANRAADILNLEPVDVAQRLARFAQRVAHGLMDALFRNADYIHDLVGLVRHGCLRSV